MPTVPTARLGMRRRKLVRSSERHRRGTECASTRRSVYLSREALDQAIRCSKRSGTPFGVHRLAVARAHPRCPQGRQAAPPTGSRQAQ
eukprot:1871062-Prymnesium_polylepis.2